MDRRSGDPARAELEHAQSQVERVEHVRTAVEHLQREARVEPGEQEAIEFTSSRRDWYFAIHRRAERGLDTPARVHLDTALQLCRQQGFAHGRQAHGRVARRPRHAGDAGIRKVGLRRVVRGVSVVYERRPFDCDVERHVASAPGAVLRVELLVAHDDAVQAPPRQLGHEKLPSGFLVQCAAVLNRFAIFKEEAVLAHHPALVRGGSVETAVDGVHAETMVARADAGSWDDQRVSEKLPVDEKQVPARHATYARLVVPKGAYPRVRDWHVRALLASRRDARNARSKRTLGTHAGCAPGCSGFRLTAWAPSRRSREVQRRGPETRAGWRARVTGWTGESA